MPESDRIKALARAGQKIERQLNDLRDDLKEYSDNLRALQAEESGNKPPKENNDPEPKKSKGFFDDFFKS